jgi:peroxisomal 2,4-dienoyl-CoA reductase
MLLAMSVFAPDILEGRAAVITGGGTGICKGIAKRFLEHGAAVCITSRKEDVLSKAAAELRQATGGRVVPIACDVREPESLAAMVEKASSELGRIDTLVNGAAGNFLAPAVSLSENAFKTVVEIDLQGTFNACKACFEHLRDSEDGLILNISATLHYRGTPMQLHASAAKAGVDALTRNLAVEWGPAIRSVAIAPGPIGDTEGMKRLAPGDFGERMKARVPLRRFGTIDEIANTAVFLRSSAGAYINGTVIVVDGGECISMGAL